MLQQLVCPHDHTSNRCGPSLHAKLSPTFNLCRNFGDVGSAFLCTAAGRTLNICQPNRELESPPTLSLNGLAATAAAQQPISARPEVSVPDPAVRSVPPESGLLLWS